jgi:ketopantoate reductase
MYYHFNINDFKVISSVQIEYIIITTINNHWDNIIDSSNIIFNQCHIQLHYTNHIYKSINKKNKFHIFLNYL